MPAGIRQLLDVVGLPAFVEGRYFDVLAANSLAHALSPNLQVGQNRLRAVFLDPAEEALYPDWDGATRHDVQVREGMPTRIHHPQVGDLTLSGEKLAIGGAEGQMLVVYHAQPGTSSAEKLALLATLATPTITVAARSQDQISERVFRRAVT